ncbi:hypothetical protein [Photobacterium kishitanii]|uniref:Uncharacterized protein n=1 Tax=Photobacterium kishitanii TaxID=318456 RepID=A0A2T3KEJ2_9GAMM|nr:hypothetical protein [Photobacterium kishitanii]PSU95737.1 hypothetical protein C9J27_17850 [Photobacterium kishitanii]PSV11645.1 hypothetical protein C0W59_19115 [Photobacterium kishitanii]
MKKVLLFLLVLLGIFAPLLSYLYLFEPFNFLSSHIETINKVTRYQAGALFVFIMLVWVYVFVHCKILKYGFHVIAGAISIIFALLAIAGVCFEIYSLLCLILLSLAGLLSIYCVSVPLVVFFQNKIRGSWEYIIITIIFGSSLTFIISGYASVIVNEIFGINAKYLPYSTVLSMFIVLSPFLAIISFILLLVIIFLKIDLFKNEYGHNKFYLINAFVGCYILFIMSIGVGSHSSKSLERVASIFDFDSYHYCVFSEKVDGVIFLDSQYSKVLTYKKGRKPLYTVMVCNIK